MMRTSLTSLTHLSVAGLVVTGGLALAAGQYGPGVGDTEIKIGNTMPYSGPASPYGTIGKSEAAYFTMINKQAASMVARSTLLVSTMVTVRRKPSNKFAS